MFHLFVCLQAPYHMPGGFWKSKWSCKFFQSYRDIYQITHSTSLLQTLCFTGKWLSSPIMTILVLWLIYVTANNTLYHLLYSNLPDLWHDSFVCTLILRAYFLLKLYYNWFSFWNLQSSFTSWFLQYLLMLQ